MEGGCKRRKATPFLISPASSLATITEPVDISALRLAAIADVEQIAVDKSRQLKPVGSLPSLIELPVRTQAGQQQLSRQPNGRVEIPEKQFVTQAIESAFRLGRKTFLLGDLGSGKSTLVAEFAKKRMEEDAESVVLFFPCKFLRLDKRFLISELIQALDRYIAEQIFPTDEQPNLTTLLSESVNVTLVFDGIDELATSFAPHFVKQIARLVSNWHSVQIVATGRPVELIGVGYSSWNVCEICQLTDDQKLEILQFEFEADGVNANQAATDAKLCVKNLKNYPLMNLVAVTPLALRLVSKKLRVIGAEDAPTLGDLLFDLAGERLSKWSERDGRETKYKRFSDCFPLTDDRIKLLGKLALEFHSHGSSLTKDVCAHRLAESIDADDSQLIAEEALQFYCESGLLAIDKEVEFRFEPLMQVCAGAELFSSWVKNTDDYDLGGVSWRIASFATSIARRKGCIEQVRKKLTYCLEQLLRKRIGVPAACYIVIESRDQLLAQTVLQLFGKLGRRPLWWNSNEQHASSQAIASTIVLAGDDGFDWLFESYLDPRVPIINRGCAIISSVFQSWISLTRDKLNESQTARLATLVKPYRAFDSTLFILQKLVFVCPHEFTIDEQIWLLANQIGTDSALGTCAKEKIVEQFKGSNREIVNATLVKQSESSIEAAFLFLNLNDGEIPPAIALSIIRKCSGSKIQNRVDVAVDRCKAYFGTEKWKAILRLCVASNEQERSISANAARLLYELGERDFELLVEPLMEGMHGGLRAYKCEDYAKELVAERPLERATLIANKIIGFRDGIGGAHAGWWRILFDNLDVFAENAPSILADCVQSIGPYLLARHPDIRLAFRKRMEMPEFHDEFLRRLWDVNPAIRFGAGMVLTIFNSTRQCEAVFSVIKGRPYTRQFGFYEWEEFFLSLEFGFTVQEYVFEHMDKLPAQSKVLALALLAKSEFKLTSENIEELRELQLEVENSTIKGLAIKAAHPSTEESFQQLKQHLQNLTGEKARASSNLLLQYHSAKLTEEERIACWIGLTANGKLTPEAMVSELCRLADDQSWRKSFIKFGSEKQKDAGASSFLLDAALAISKIKPWNAVVWKIFCDDSRQGIDLDEECSGFFEFCLTKPEFQSEIGKAAKLFLYDSRIDKTRYTDKYHWLALVAAKFANLDDSEIESALCCSTSIHGSSSRSLVALLGRIPANLPKRDRCLRLPDFPVGQSEHPVEDDVVAELEKASLQSDHIFPDTNRLIEAAVFACQPTDGWLDGLSNKGLHGKLIAQYLRYCFGKEQSVKDRVALVEGGWASRSQQNDHVRNSLFRSQNRVFMSQLSRMPSQRAEYLKELYVQLSSTTDWRHAIIYEILKTAGRLETEYTEKVFCEYARHQGTLHHVVGEMLVAWLAGELEGQEADAVVDAARKAISILNEMPWDKPGHGYGSVPFPYLIFPLLIWRFQKESSHESAHVFLRGIRYMFSADPRQPSGSTKSSFEVIEPLFRKVPHEFIKQAISEGEEFPDVAIRSFVHLLRSITDGQTQSQKLHD